jgi:hypothetical protein
VVQLIGRTKKTCAWWFAVFASTIPWVLEFGFGGCDVSFETCVLLPIFPAFVSCSYLFLTSRWQGKSAAFLLVCLAILPNWMLWWMFLAWSVGGFGV